MRILCFNWHEPYIELFARTGHDFIVAPPYNQQTKTWNTNFRPLPDNVHLCKYTDSIYHACNVDLILCFTLQDCQLIHAAEISTPMLFVELNLLSECCNVVGNPDAHKKLLENLYKQPFMKNLNLAFISDMKRDDWGFIGKHCPVIVSGVDTDYWNGYTGEKESILRVGNNMKNRDAMQGFSIGNRIVYMFQSTLVGEQGPSLIHQSQVGPANSVNDLRSYYINHRVMLSCLNSEREDGYNLAVLEAMSTGMPIIALRNDSAPKCDGVIQVDTVGEARTKITRLLNDKTLAYELGQTCRLHIIDHFNINTFITEWDYVFSRITTQ